MGKGVKIHQTGFTVLHGILSFSFIVKTWEDEIKRPNIWTSRNISLTFKYINHMTTHLHYRFTQNIIVAWYHFQMLFHRTYIIFKSYMLPSAPVTNNLRAFPCMWRYKWKKKTSLFTKIFICIIWKLFFWDETCQRQYAKSTLRTWASQTFMEIFSCRNWLSVTVLNQG